MDVRCSPDRLTLEVVAAFDRPVVRLDIGGELDSMNVGRLVAVVAGLLRDQPLERVEFGLASLFFIDAYGVRGLLECDGLVRRAGGRLLLIDPSPLTRRILQVTGVLRTLDLAEQDPTPSPAVRSTGSPR